MAQVVPWHHRAVWRLLVATAVGLAVCGLTSWWNPQYALMLGWTALSGSYVAATWLSLWPMDADATRAHAQLESPAGPVLHALLVLAALASLLGIGFLIAAPTGSRSLSAVIALCPVVASWAVIHTLYALRYARSYYAAESGIDFHCEDPPRYSDFAYVAFTVGMSYAVSDTDVQAWGIRRTALSHALLAYLFGTVFLATLVNILASLAA
ncbi:MAG: DUF1345 domain-containing protein [Propionibacteriaceae bacterium]|jgi:uncharacterized membrane protein|nr:DUF1345 domain-containing protein [Propionibacteriaceae bacterium]